MEQTNHPSYYMKDGKVNKCGVQMMFSQSLMMPKPDFKGVKDEEVIIDNINRAYDDYYFKKRYEMAGISEEEAETLNVGLYKTLCMEMAVGAELLDLRVKLYRLKLKELTTYTNNLELYCKQYRKNLNAIGKEAAFKVIVTSSKFSDIIRPYRIDLREAIADKIVKQHIEHPELIILAYSSEILAGKAANMSDEILRHIPGIFPGRIRDRFKAVDYRPMKKMITTFRKKVEEICGKADLRHGIKINNAVKKIMDSLDILEEKERKHEK